MSFLAVIVFVPNRKQSRLTAIDLLAYAASEGNAQRFVHMPADDQDFKQMLDKIKVRVKQNR